MKTHFHFLLGNKISIEKLGVESGSSLLGGENK